MKTILSGSHSEVTIDTEGPVRIIGESINPTRRKKLINSLQEGRFDYVLELAASQIACGAEVLDVNVGYPGVDDAKLLPETVRVLQDNFDIPLCLDSPNHLAIEAALRASKGKCIINSVNGEEHSLKTILPIAKEYGSAVIALLMDDDGITHDPHKRLSIAEKIVERAIREGIMAENVIIDPLAMAVSADQNACLVTLETIRLVRQKLGMNITIGASNVSFGLPDREALNAAFTTLAIYNGLTCPIANPEKIAIYLLATDLVLGRDPWAVRFVENYQKSL